MNGAIGIDVHDVLLAWGWAFLAIQPTGQMAFCIVFLVNISIIHPSISTENYLCISSSINSVSVYFRNRTPAIFWLIVSSDLDLKHEFLLPFLEFTLYIDVVKPLETAVHCECGRVVKAVDLSLV